MRQSTTQKYHNLLRWSLILNNDLHVANIYLRRTLIGNKDLMIILIDKHVKH